MPIKTLFDHLEEGDSIDVFLDVFPGVSREQAVALLETAMHTVIDKAGI